MKKMFLFFIKLKGEGSQEERRGRKENGKRERKGILKCSLLLLSCLMFSCTLEVQLSPVCRCMLMVFPLYSVHCFVQVTVVIIFHLCVHGCMHLYNDSAQ